MMTNELPQPILELSQQLFIENGNTSNINTTNNNRNSMSCHKCSILIDENEIMVSRRMPREFFGVMGFIEFNRFCDRLDTCLQPLREIKESRNSNKNSIISSPSSSSFSSSSGKEEKEKTKVLESMQKLCDKVTVLFPALDFTLYCPFHNPLVRDWHLQVSIDKEAAIQQQQHQREECEYEIVPSSISHQMPNNIINNENNDTDGYLDDGAEATISDANQTSQQHVNQHVHHVSAATADQSSTTHGDGNTQNDNDNPRNNYDNLSNNNQQKHCTFFGRNNGQDGIFGIDYIEHEVLPTDTLKGICLMHNVSAVRLKQANLMSGDNDSLLLAPKTLAIPISEGYYARGQNVESKDYKLSVLSSKFPKLGHKEAIAYLELTDWVLADAIETAQEDIAWEKETKDDIL